MSDLELLKGKRLKGVSQGKWPEGTQFPKKSHAYGGVFGQNDKLITFHCENGDYVFLADGDCCSESFINSVEGPTEGLIVEVREPNWEPFKEETNGEDDVVKYYKATFVIEGKGFLDVEYRNESNGYYGGSLELLAAPRVGTDTKG